MSTRPPGNPDAWKLSDIYRHKASVHFRECLTDILTIMGGSVSTLDEAIIKAWNLAASRDCEVEIDLFASQHNFKAPLIAGMMENRIPALVADDLRAIGYPMWKPHKESVAQASQRAEAARALQKIEDAERAKAEQAAKLIIEAERAEQLAKMAAEQERRQAEQDALEVENLERESLRKKFFAWFESQMQDNYLDSESVTPPVELHITQKELSTNRAEFVYSWLVKNVFGGDVTALHFDQEQALAVGSVSKHTLVTARAGAGKTQVIALRAVFMIAHCGVDPKSMLLLTYNKAAQLEMANRIFDLLIKFFGLTLPAVQRDTADNNFAKSSTLKKHGFALPEVSTIHSLAYRVVQAQRSFLGMPALAVLSDDEKSGNKARTIALVRARTEFMQVTENFQRIKSFVLAHFSKDWLELLPALEVSALSGLLDKENMTRQTLGGEIVKSHGEKVIADYLFSHNVAYEYEAPLRSPDNRGFLRPDFTVPLRSGPMSSLIIEYFGVQGSQLYEAERKKKLAAFRARKAPFLELFPDDIRSGQFKVKITNFLTAQGADPKDIGPLSQHDLEDRVYRAQGKSFFERTVEQVISRARQHQLSPHQLQQLGSSPAVKANQDEVGTLFDLTSGIYENYLRVLDDEGSNDFDGLITEARDAIVSGEISKIRGDVDLTGISHIALDEYQDFSPTFHNFVESIRSATGANVFAVGDDWQSINSHLGAEPQIFSRFPLNYEDARTLSISTNRRSVKTIVDLGNSLMDSTRSTPARAQTPDTRRGFIGIFDLTKFQQVPHESGASNRSKAASRIIKKILLEGDPSHEVTILSRRRKDPTDFPKRTTSPNRENLELLGDELKQGLTAAERARVNVSSTHSFKGKQSRSIILWDADRSSYPLIHPGWIYLQPFGTTLESVTAEERRLLYVAITRAETSLYLMYSGSLSPFFGDTLEALKGNFPPAQDVTAGLRENAAILRVRNGHDVKEELKVIGFRWNKPESCWDLEINLGTLDIESYKKRLLMENPEWLVNTKRSEYEISLKGKNTTLSL